MNHLAIDLAGAGARISRHLYGHFAEHLGRCIYDGFWVGEDSPIPNVRGIRSDIVAALRAIKVPVLRWPGGCFADNYHWRDGVGPRANRPPTLNAHWGEVVETNHFGTHEFLDLCEQLDCAPYICGNVGSGSVAEMRDWVEYITCVGDSRMARLRREHGREKRWQLPFFGVGNENWGCGGSMRPEFYADEYRRYQTYVRNIGQSRIYRIACGANSDDCRWTEVMMEQAAAYMDGLSLHYYTVPGRWERKNSATDFGETEWALTMRTALKMAELIQRHGAIMDRYDPKKQIGMMIDEWGTWYEVEPGTNPRFLFQQNTLRDALTAGITLNLFNNHCDRVRMANIAQTINVLQAMVLTEGEKMVLTPTYHVFAMYAVHHGAQLLPTRLEAPSYDCDGESAPALSASASQTPDGQVNATLCNIDPTRNHELTVELSGMAPAKVAARVLTHEQMNAHNRFDQPPEVQPRDYSNARVADGRIHLELPAKSVVALAIS